MGGLTLGGGYFGEYSAGGAPPVTNPAAADVIVLARELVTTVAVPEWVAIVIVPQQISELE